MIPPTPGKSAIVEIKVNGIEVLGIWDSASPYTMVGPEVMEVLFKQGVKVNPLNDVMYSAGGDPFPAQGWAHLKLEFPGKEFTHPVVFAPSLAGKCLLGADIMEAYGATVVFSKDVWYWDDIPHVRFPFIGSEKRGGQVNLIKSQNFFEHVDAASLSPEQKEVVVSLFEKYPEVMTEEPGRTDLVYHHIETGNAKPISLAPYRMSPLKLEALDEILNDMLRRGQIVPGNGPWAAPAFLRPKADSSWRLCINYQRLNEVTVKDKYPLPRIDELIDWSTQVYHNFGLARRVLAGALKPRFTGEGCLHMHVWVVYPFFPTFGQSSDVGFASRGRCGLHR